MFGSICSFHVNSSFIRNSTTVANKINKQERSRTSGRGDDISGSFEK
nr:MAG TPA: hypothetical protein [Caudoviricetes sp.]DAV25565.1 MAG TPA: hypothetical protein [Caudoviricetes sp.]